MPRVISVFDANPYRVLAHGLTTSDLDSRVEKLRDLERSKSVIAYVGYWTLFELAAHLADINDAGFTDCRSAIRALWHHCFLYDGSRERLPFLADGEAQLTWLLFGKSLAARKKSYKVLEYLASKIADATTPSDVQLHEKTLRYIAGHCARQEQQFVDDMRKFAVEGLDPSAQNWRALQRNPELRRQALGYIDSTAGDTRCALMFAIRTASQQEAVPSDTEMNRHAQTVLSAYPTPIALYKEIIKRILTTGCDLTKNNRANWIWDIQTCFAVSKDLYIDGIPVWLVTDDKDIISAATHAGSRSRVHTLAEYQDLLRNGLPQDVQ